MNTPLTSQHARSTWSRLWQLKSNKIALALFSLFCLLAIYAPALCSDLPFILTSTEGTSSPWLANLFNKNYYENAVDILFNILALALPPFALLALLTRALPFKAPPLSTLILPLLLLTTLAFSWISLDPLAHLSHTPSETLSPLGWYEDEFPDPQTKIERARQLGHTPWTLSAPHQRSFRATSNQTAQAPSNAHPLGTDNLGRDNLARLLFGARVALAIGILAVSIYSIIGTLLGAIAGYFGGWIDILILRFVEVMMCFPSLILILTLAALVETPSVFHVMLIIGLTRWTGPARLVRAEVLKLKEQDFIHAARALGLSQWRIIYKHILPNAISPVLVAATLGVASAILIESTLSFLGLSDPSAPTWGKMLNDGRVFRNHTLVIIPGLAIFFTVALFNFLGEALRDALDPKLKNEKTPQR